MESKKYFTSWGPICGDCGHLHRSRKAAEKCIENHHRGCQSQGGYSDRTVRCVTRQDMECFDVARGPGEAVSE